MNNDIRNVSSMSVKLKNVVNVVIETFILTVDSNIIFNCRVPYNRTMVFNRSSTTDVYEHYLFDNYVYHYVIYRLCTSIGNIFL